MRLWNRIASDTRVIAILLGVCAFQALVICGLVVDLVTIPTRLTIHVPPEIGNGATFRASHIPRPYIGQFAFNVMQALDDWSHDGVRDAGKNLETYGAYLTPGFLWRLRRRARELRELGQLQNRTRVIRPIVDERPTVTRLGPGRWRVGLRVRDSEYVNGVLIKDRKIEYPLIVVRFDGDEQANPFGLALAGFASPPRVVRTFK